MLPITTSDAAEDGKGIYVPGLLASLAVFIPPPGTYITTYKYSYSGNASGKAANSIALNQLCNITLEADVDVEAQLSAEIPQTLAKADKTYSDG